MTDQPRADAIAALRAALPHAVNFRFLPPRPVTDPLWDEIARELAAALAPADPTADACICVACPLHGEDETPTDYTRWQGKRISPRAPADPTADLRAALRLVDEVIFDLPIGNDVTYSRGYSAGTAAARESLREALREALRAALAASTPEDAIDAYHDEEANDEG